MMSPEGSNSTRRVRIGAVSYLNTRPLVWRLPALLPEAQIVVDLPSRLADGLAAGELDVAIVPSVEYFRHPGWTIVSDACISCDGPVKSVKLYSRVPVERIRTLALDEGSRTSAALATILLKERFHLSPERAQLPIGSSLADCTADAAVVIGDRGMRAVDGCFEFVWDLGEEWSAWTGLPFVFAMWVARPAADLARLSRALTAARNEGERLLECIAAHEAPQIGLPFEECLAYLRDNLVFRLGGRQRRGLEAFRRLAVCHGLAPQGAKLVFDDHKSA
jgi:chorismate dehydratase